MRRTQPLKHLRIIRNVRIELQRLEHQLATDPRLFETLRRDPTERLKWSEGGMHLLLQLDSLQGLHPVVRESRKPVTKDVIRYQEYIDSAGKLGAHVPYVPPLGQTLPQAPSAHGYQSTYSTTSSAPGVQKYAPHGSNQQGVTPYVPGRGERPFSPTPPQNQYAAQPEKTFYPPQGPSRYEYDARFPPGTEPDVIDLFRKADVDGSGAIDTKELQRILSLKFFNFSRRTVRLMLHLFADDTTVSSRLGPSAFVKLWRELKKWQRTFKSFDNDESGSIDLPELREAMLSLGIGVTPQVLQLLVFNYDRTGLNSSIAFGDFIECGLIVKGLTEKFICHDPEYTGAAKIDYQAFMMMVLPFIVA